MAHRDTEDNSSPLDNSSSDSDSDDMEALLRMMGLCCSRQEKELTQEEYDLMLGHIAKYIQSDSCKNIITMAGAGISTSAGIPDFRSPKTGLYATLADKYPELSRPEDIFNIAFFRENPSPFLKLAKELMQPPGDDGFQPTPCHYFIKHLSDKGMLLRHYTQNIDGLERKAGVPEDKLIEAHGSFNKAHCISKGCREEYSESWLRDMVQNDTVPTCNKCNSLVKPDIVFFGESLPERFHTSVMVDFKVCDLLIVMGTSLAVQPFASLVNMVPKECPLLFINLENAAPWLFKKAVIDEAEFEGANRKVFWKGTCDDGCTKLESLLGWNTTKPEEKASSNEDCSKTQRQNDKINKEQAEKKEE